MQQQIDAFFVGHSIRVELDPNLISKAAASATRIRLRTNTGFSEYDRNQLLMHEAYVHTLTGLNGREQPVLGSMARGSPRTTATQEGLATLSEMMSGSMDIERMKRISLRIIAIDMAIRGADFVEVFRYFLAAGQNEVDVSLRHSASTAACRSAVARLSPRTRSICMACSACIPSCAGAAPPQARPRQAVVRRQDGVGRCVCPGTHVRCHIAAPRYLPPWIQRANGLAGMLAFSLFANKIRLDNVEADDLVLGL